MNLSNILIALFVFSGVVLGLGGFYSDMSSQYNQTNTFNQTASAWTSDTDTIAVAMNNSINTEGGLLSLVWSYGELIFKAPLYIGKAFLNTGATLLRGLNQASGYIGLPSWAIALIFSAIGCITIFAVIRAVWNKEY
jgi:hypothetical protein